LIRGFVSPLIASGVRANSTCFLPVRPLVNNARNESDVNGCGFGDSAEGPREGKEEEEERRNYFSDVSCCITPGFDDDEGARNDGGEGEKKKSHSCIVARNGDDDTLTACSDPASTTSTLTCGGEKKQKKRGGEDDDNDGSTCFCVLRLPANAPVPAPSEEKGHFGHDNDDKAPDGFNNVEGQRRGENGEEKKTKKEKKHQVAAENCRATTRAAATSFIWSVRSTALSFYDVPFGNINLDGASDFDDKEGGEEGGEKEEGRLCASPREHEKESNFIPENESGFIPREKNLMFEAFGSGSGDARQESKREKNIYLKSQSQTVASEPVLVRASESDIPSKQEKESTFITREQNLTENFTERDNASSNPSGHFITRFINSTCAPLQSRYASIQPCCNRYCADTTKYTDHSVCP
jgi:hypothetical protein